MGYLFTPKIFNKHPGIICAASTAKYGNLSYKWSGVNNQSHEDVFKNRLRFFSDLGVDPETVVSADLEQGDKIVTVSEKDGFKGIKDSKTGIPADCLVTGSKGVSLFVIVADCLAISFFDPINNVVALAHVGYKGADLNLPYKTVKYLEANFGSKSSDLLVWLPPALHRESTVFQYLGFKDLSKWQNYIEQVGEEYLIDWIGFAKDQLIEAGVKVQNVEDSGVDTLTNSEFYSYTRSRQTGEAQARFGVVIGLK